MDQIYNTEIQKRREFGLQFDRHFLRDLFPGLEDFPKPFANQKPEPFDAHLPDVCDLVMAKVLFFESTVFLIALSVNFQIFPEDVEKLKSAFSWVQSDEDFTLDLPTSTRSDESTRSTLEMENLQLKLELENFQSELQAKDEELGKFMSDKADEIRKLESELKTKESELHNERIVVDRIKEESEAREEEVRLLKLNLQSLKIDTENQILSLRQTHEQKVEDLRKEQEAVVEELTAQFHAEKEEAIKTVKEKCKSEADSLKARFKFMSSIEQKSPVDSIEVNLSLCYCLYLNKFVLLFHDRGHLTHPIEFQCRNPMSCWLS